MSQVSLNKSNNAPVYHICVYHNSVWKWPTCSLQSARRWLVPVFRLFFSPFFFAYKNAYFLTIKRPKGLMRNDGIRKSLFWLSSPSSRAAIFFSPFLFEWGGGGRVVTRERLSETATKQSSFYTDHLLKSINLHLILPKTQRQLITSLHLFTLFVHKIKIKTFRN